MSEFSDLRQINVPSCYYESCRQPVSFELHGFSDASSIVYGAVVYLRIVYRDGKTSLVIVASKTCVAPIKAQIIPRLELLAAVILTRLVATLKKSLESLTDLTTYY